MFGRMGHLHSYKWKVAGWIIGALGALCLLINYFIPLNLIAEFDAQQHIMLYWWVALYGLYTTTFSRERREDERTPAVRATAMRITLALTLGATLAFAVTSWLAPDVEFAVDNLLIIPTFALVLYQLVFYVGVYFDKGYDYDGNKPFNIFNLPGNPVMKIVLIITLLALLIGYLANKGLVK